MQRWVNFNGSFIENDQTLITADNRGLRYGDGLFETMRSDGIAIKHRDLHFNRLFEGISALKIRFSKTIIPTFLEREVHRTLEKNNITGAARIRLMIIRGDGGLFEADKPGNYIIQTWPLETAAAAINDNGLVIGLYDKFQKSCDQFSNIKSNNYLGYAMAALHAKENRWNDSVVLNIHGRPCDTSIANIFWMKNEKIFTPPLSEGCVAGVMRKHLLNTYPEISEKQCTVADLETADEIGLSNAIQGLRWVQSFNEFRKEKTICSRLSSSTI